MQLDYCDPGWDISFFFNQITEVLFVAYSNYTHPSQLFVAGYWIVIVDHFDKAMEAEKEFM